jgi:hypothetical protein
MHWNWQLRKVRAALFSSLAKIGTRFLTRVVVVVRTEAPDARAVVAVEMARQRAAATAS